MKLEMASSQCCSASKAKTNHFFKIILSDSDSHTKLMIPRKFVRKYGKSLDACILLKLPNGLVWPVNLERHEGEVWLQNGWPEFARFYSIQCGYLLIFEYLEQYCDVKVLIFDPSGTEIDYPANLSFGKPTKVRKREIDDSTSSDSDLSRPRKKTAKLGDSGSATGEAKTRALASAEAFKSNNPFFVVAMKKSHVDGKWRGMVVRKAFEESYKKWKDNDKVYLQVAGKSWVVNCDIKWNKCRLSCGWDGFAQDNKLNVGDVCVFELINASRKLLQVFIFREAKEINSKLGDGGSAFEEDQAKDRALALASAEAFKSQKPFFVLAMKQSHVDGKGSGLVVRKAFEKSYQMWKHHDQVILQFSGKTWLVYCDINRNRCRLRRGWDKFVRDNLLTVGDVCVFKLINASRKLLQVFIYRATKETNGKGNETLPRVRSEAEEAKVLTSVGAFTSKYPFFTVKVYPSSLYGGSLSLQKKFIERYISKDSCNVILQISDGRAWLVKCIVYNTGTKFSVGWKIFARANHLAAGDVCVFELINRSEKLLNVVIYRNKSLNFK